jgi:hypothetical protein
MVVSPLTPLEHAIHSILLELNDPCHIVEYWSRDEYMNMDAHVDIAEQELEDNNNNDNNLPRCPSSAHILYLQIKQDLRAPTCVFPKKVIGWGSSTTTAADDDDDDDQNHHHDQNNNNNNNNKGGGGSWVPVDLVTIPPVQGRVVRFPGNAMHAVPYPADRWFMTDHEEMELRKEEEEEEEYDDDDDDDDDFGGEHDDEEEVERAVLLFNTWPDHAPPPRGVKRYDDTEHSTEPLVMEDWGEDMLDGMDPTWIHCNPVSSWHQQPIVTDGITASPEDGQARVNLMGEQHRRLYPKDTVRLHVPVPELRAALEQETTVTHFCLLEKQL